MDMHKKFYILILVREQKGPYIYVLVLTVFNSTSLHAFQIDTHTFSSPKLPLNKMINNSSFSKNINCSQSNS